MVFQGIGACVLMKLMRLDRETGSDWLLYGPSDPDVIEDEDEPPFLLAAE